MFVALRDVARATVLLFALKRLAADRLAALFAGLIGLTACSPDAGGGLLAGPACRPSELRTPFVVATFNIHGGVGRDGRRDVGLTAATLDGAQFAGLQEVDNGRPRSFFDNQARTLSTLLHHPYWQHFAAEDYWPAGTYGLAATSSLPIVASRSITLPTAAGRPSRRLASITASVDCRPVHIFIYHATHGLDRQDWNIQLQAVLDTIDREIGAPPARHIFMGDFNADSSNPVIRRLQERWVDPLRSAARAGRTDYIFVGGGLEVIEAHEVDRGASDHPAVFVTVR